MFGGVEDPKRAQGKGLEGRVAAVRLVENMYVHNNVGMGAFALWTVTSVGEGVRISSWLSFGEK